MTTSAKPRLLVFIVAYHAEATIRQVLRRIPIELGAEYDVEILIIDDDSRIKPFAKARGPTPRACRSR